MKMANRVRKVNYCYLTVPSRAGQGEKILGALQDAGVNLLAFTGFPAGAGKAQVDLVSDDIAKIRRVAKRQGWRLSTTKKGFLVQGDDKVGAVHNVVARLSKTGINVTAVDAVAAGGGRYGMILWVKPKHYNQAAKALNAK
jgi:hypothetical protein